ncbi:MAG: hypothetical protein V4671_24500 [Armatimonadota bacterium]
MVGSVSIVGSVSPASIDAFRIERCDYCGVRKPIRETVSGDAEGQTFRGFACFDCSVGRGAKRDTIPLAVARWARERNVQNFQCREIRAALLPTKSGSYRVGPLTLERVERIPPPPLPPSAPLRSRRRRRTPSPKSPASQREEPGATYAGVLRGPFESLVVLYWTAL